MQSTSCIDTAYVNIKGNSVRPLIELNKYSIDFGLLALCQTKLDTIIVTNRGTGSVSITSRGQISGANQSFFRIITEPINVPYTLQPNGSETYIIEFVPSAGASGTKNADFSVSTDEPSMPNIIVPLTGRSDSIRVSAPLLVDFGGVPIGNIRTQTITLTNNGEIDVRVIRVDSDNPNVSVIPQTVSILANGGTADFDISMNFINGGVETAKLSFIIDIPCTDTHNVDVKGEGLVGNIENTASLDYGILAPCEDSIKTVMVTNTGTAPIELIPSPILRGIDKSLYIILDTNSYSKILNPGDSSFIDVQFKPTGSTDGIKQAELAIPVFMNNDTIEVTTVLRGERRSGIVMVPNQVVFGSVTIGTISERLLILKNAGTIPVTISSVPFNGYFMVIPDPFPTTILQPGDSIVLRIQFSPDSIKFYQDTLQFGIQVLSCLDRVSVIVNGNGAPAKSVYVRLPHLLNVPPDQMGYRIPVIGRLLNPNDTLIGSSFEADIGFDSTLFFPVSLSKGNILSSSRDRKNVVITIQIPGLDIGKNPSDSILTEIIGYTLLGDTTFTDLKWYDFRWTGSEPINQPTMENGSLEIQICRRGQDRLLKHGSPVTMSVSPNPADDYLSVDIAVLETGSYRIELMGLTGEINQIKNWEVNLNSNNNYRFNFDINNVSSGMYYLILKSPTRYVVVPVMVVK